MRLLVDTHVFLWWIVDDPRLSDDARAAISDPGSEVLFSAASGWEIAIKAGLGRVRLPEDATAFIPAQVESNGFSVLPIHLRHALRVLDLPDHHRDPFDRMLVAQALEEGLTIVSTDDQIGRYDVPRIS